MQVAVGEKQLRECIHLRRVGFRKSTKSRETMAEALLLNGVAVAEKMKSRVAQLACFFSAEAGRPPGIAVVLAGENPASQVYVRSKLKLARELGLHSVEHRPAADISDAALLDLIATL